MSQTIPARADVDARFTWNLSDIFPTDDAWREEFARVHAQLDTLRGYRASCLSMRRRCSASCVLATN